MEGWIKIHRKISENELWTKGSFSKGQAWVDLIILANHKPGYFFVRDIKVNIERGQVGWSVVGLSKRWGWSRGKIQRFLDELEMVQQIVQQKSRITTLISIVNYDEYQLKGQQTVQQTDTDKKYTVSNVKNSSKIIKETRKEKIEKTIEQYKVWREESKWERYREFITWLLNENLESCFMLSDQFSEKKFKDLTERHNVNNDVIKNKISAMENQKNLEKNNKSFSRTLNNWLNYKNK